MATPLHTFIKDPPGWQTLEMNLQFQNPHLQVYLAKVRTPMRPDGAPWTIVHRKGAAIIAPITLDGSLLLIRQERLPIRESIWEFPAGQIDSAAEADDTLKRETALRELREETGYELAPTGELIPMGHYFSSPGFTDEHGFIFLARGVVPSPHGPAHEESEAIHEVRAFPPAEFRRMIATNEIRDANTLATFARMSALGFI